MNDTTLPNHYQSSCKFKSSKKTRSYRSATFAAVLLGMGGVVLLKNKLNKDLFNKSFFPVAYCACKDEICEDSNCLRTTEREEEMIRKANAELEKALKETKSKAVEFTEVALKAYCNAIEALKIFLKKVLCAVEEENLDCSRFEEVWCDLYNALTKRCDLAKQAIEKGQCAWELLRRLREIIENGKTCKYTQCNPLLITAEDTLICAEKEMYAKKSMMDCLLKESRVAEQYQNLIEEFRRDLKAESESLLPTQKCRVTLTDNEVIMVLTHVYKKILRVQKELGNGEEKC